MDLARAVPGDKVLRACVATLGNFDGMHLGHRRLVGETVQSARGRGLPSVAVTFDPHPTKILAPDQSPRLLMTLAQKLDTFERIGIDLAWVIPFGRDFSLLDPETFLASLFGALCPVEMHVGSAFRFGRDRAGDVSTLGTMGARAGCAVHPHSYRAPDGGPLSSDRVRRLLLDGDVALARELLDAPFRLTGVVVEGDRRGRTMGFPTANLAWEQELLPAPGVYVTGVRSRAIAADLPAQGITNVGTKPTFGGQSTTVETHLPGMAADLYGARLEIDFLHRLRGEEKFASPDDLRTKIADDLGSAADIWGKTNTTKKDACLL